MFEKPLLLCVLFLQMMGCATVNGPADDNDPFESYNRAMYSFNETVDKNLLKPIVKGYKAVVPNPVDKGVTNFFSNLDDFIVFINDLLQFKLVQASSDASRFLVNSTIGLLGTIDVASSMGLRKNNEDFGQTLGYWGIGDGPYIVLPFFGPSSIRDGVGLLTDFTQFDPTLNYIDNTTARNRLFVLDTIDTRADLLSTSRLLNTIALDPYITIREAYLQRRRYLVYDGNPPVDDGEGLDYDLDNDGFES